MPRKPSTGRQRIRQHWTGGTPLDAGRLVAAGLPADEQPPWAARILRLVLDRDDVRALFPPTVVGDVLLVADTRRLWRMGRSMFSRLREETLQLDEWRRRAALSAELELLASVLSLAEYVAKVVYNATSPADEFDDDAAWYVVAGLRGFVDRHPADTSFARSAWAAVTNEPAPPAVAAPRARRPKRQA